MTLCNKLFENAGWDFFPPAALFKFVRLLWFSLSISSFQMLRFSPGGLSYWSEGGPCGQTPWCFCSSTESARGSGAGSCCVPGRDVGLPGILPANHFALSPVVETLLGAWCLCDTSRTVLMSKGDSCNQVSVSPDFCYTGLESSWKVFPACVVACGAFLHWLLPCGSTHGAGTQLTEGDSGITSTWKSTNCT